MSAVYSSPAFVGLSLWLVPRDPAQTELQSIIDELATTHGTPTFAPHITLAAGLKGDKEAIVSACDQLATRLPPMELEIDDCSCKDLYFQSVFALVKKEDNLMQAERTTMEALGHFDPAAGGDYMPHASLLYGDLDMAIRHSIVQAVADKVKGKVFHVGSMELWSTKGTVKDWERVHSFPLLPGP